MQKYIRPVRTMLGQYKQSLNNLRDNQMLLSKSTSVSEEENLCPNPTTALKINKNVRVAPENEKSNNRTNRGTENISMRELDAEIEELTKKLYLR